MDAVELLNEHIDVHKVLEHYRFDNVSPDGPTFVRASCKLHGGNNPTAFVINVENGYYYCHTNCGGGDLYTLIQRIEKCSFEASVERLAEILGVNIVDMTIKERTQSYLKEIQSWAKTMMSRRNKEVEKEFNLKDIQMRNVLEFRTFKKETLEHFNLKYVAEFQCQKLDGTPYTLKHRLAIPIHSKNGVQVGVSLRRIKSTDVPKWSHQPVSIKTGNMLYNYHEVKHSPIIVVVEGIFDVWAFHEINVPSVATYGAHLSKEQENMLLRTGSDLVICYDGDDAGRTTTEKVIEKLKGKANLSTITFNPGDDPDSISREELLKAYESRRKR